MRSRPLIPLVALVAATLVPAGARATDPLVVDAGSTQRVEVGTPFFLEVHVDETAEPQAISWTAPPGCTAAEPDSIVTTATCSEAGAKTFEVAVTSPEGAGSDAVSVIAVSSFEIPLEASGDVAAGLPDEFAGGSGSLDGASTRVPFTVPQGADTIDASLDWLNPANDIDLILEDPDGNWWTLPDGRTLTIKPRRVMVQAPMPGAWNALVQPRAAVAASWELRGTIVGAHGDQPIPDLLLPPVSGTPGEPVTIEAETAGGTPPLTIAWEATPESWAFDDGDGPSFSFTFDDPTAIKAKVTDANGLETIRVVLVRTTGTVPDDPFTVVAVIDSGFTPYHFDFVGHQHPWNLDADPSNDFDFRANPATYIDGYPAGATALEVTIPSSPDQEVDPLRQIDMPVWDQVSSSSSSNVNLYWFPRTKIIGAMTLGGGFYGNNSAHGTRSAASAAGNIHGTCPECVFMLIQGFDGFALRWVAAQPWIDVVNNSYGHCLTLCVVRDGVYLDAPTEATRAASERGQTIMFSAGNGLANAFDVPQLTYTSGEQGPDWVVTVGANSPSSDQNYLGSGKPADISSYGSSYPSTGGGTANGTGTHSGTSNAGPVVVGTFAKVLQESRALLGDLTSGNDGGIVASGAPVACGDAVPGCALGDGELTRAEWWRTVFHNVLPAPQQIAVGNQVPTTEHAYYYQGHGHVTGRLRGDDAWTAEWERMVANATGDAAAFERPAGERTWFTVDSKCRQRFWGEWSGGYYTGEEPALDPVADPLAAAFDAWCDPMPVGTFGPS